MIWRLAYLVRILECPTIDAVVRCIQSSFWEPDDVAGGEPAGSDGLKRAIPVEKIVSLLSPVR
jgi:hypothetical protein